MTEALVFCSACGLAMYLLPHGVFVCERCDQVDLDGILERHLEHDEHDE